VLENWKREFEKWLPEATVLVYSGSVISLKIARDFAFFYDLYSNGQRIKVPKFNVLLTSYETLRTNFDALAPFEWQALIIDEG
jgi:SNF2 family DNA or RNA helicase